MGEEALAGDKSRSVGFRIATYNVHKCRGLDGRTRPSRIASVLKHLRADVVALQEVIGPGRTQPGQEEEIAALLGMSSFLAPALVLRGHPYGNALLSRLPVRNQFVYDLSQRGREPRFCQRVDIEVEGRTVHIFNVHLGTSRAEREKQAKKLLPHVEDPGLSAPRIVLGDFNEWRRGAASRLLGRRLEGHVLIPYLKRGRTYPGLFPVFHLDRVYSLGPVDIAEVKAPRRWPSILASDHAPLVAHVRLHEGEAP